MSSSLDRAVDAKAASTDSLGANSVLWSVVALAMAAAIEPAIREAGKFSRGYLMGNDYPIQAVPPTIGLAGFLVAFALANRLLRLGVRWRWLLLAIPLHLVAVAAGLGLLHWTFWSMVDSSVARAQRAVEAIRAFEAARGRAPVDLKELAPEFLPSDPSLLYESGPMLYYVLDHPSLHPEAGAWKIRQHPFEQVRLEYAPSEPGRALEPGEFRKGDWIVSVWNPCWI